jgi:hypothetical protein
MRSAMKILDMQRRLWRRDMGGGLAWQGWIGELVRMEN